jgi:hypothetical protein
LHVETDFHGVQGEQRNWGEVPPDLGRASQARNARACAKPWPRAAQPASRATTSRSIARNPGDQSRPEQLRREDPWTHQLFGGNTSRSAATALLLTNSSCS